MSCLVAILLVTGAGCASDPSDATPTAAATAEPSPPSAPPVTTTTAVPSTTVVMTLPEPDITIPSGIVAAMPFQNRLDVAQGIFQVKLYNGTSELLDIVSVQFVWDGLTTPVAPRENELTGGDRLDYPVPLAPAHCTGDGTAATMPDLSKAVVRVTLRSGEVRIVPVYDVKHFAQMLYVQDCERQHIAADVGIEWVDLHAAELDGRPVTEGSLRLTRKAATATVTVKFISNTINYTFVAPQSGTGPVGQLPAGAATVDIPIRFIEGRCDAHALSESSQPFNFVAIVDLGDGVERPYAVVPAAADQVPMRDRVQRACDILNKIVNIGQTGSITGASTTTTGG